MNRVHYKDAKTAILHNLLIKLFLKRVLEIILLELLSENGS